MSDTLSSAFADTKPHYNILDGRRKLGHCTRRGEIQLSFYLMYLPEELIDYVICHELAHLKYMDHSPLFHALCNRYCGGRELLLRKQLRSFAFLLY